MVVRARIYACAYVILMFFVHWLACADVRVWLCACCAPTRLRAWVHVMRVMHTLRGASGARGIGQHRNVVVDVPFWTREIYWGERSK